MRAYFRTNPPFINPAYRPDTRCIYYNKGIMPLYTIHYLCLKTKNRFQHCSWPCWHPLIFVCYCDRVCRVLVYLYICNHRMLYLFGNHNTVFPRNLAAPRIVAAFEISPRNSNAQCTKRRPRILAACGKGSSLLLRAYVRYIY